MHLGFGIRALDPTRDAEVTLYPPGLHVEGVFEVLALAGVRNRQSGNREAALEDADGRAPVGPADDDVVFPQADVDIVTGGQVLGKGDAHLDIGGGRSHGFADDRDGEGRRDGVPGFVVGDVVAVVPRADTVDYAVGEMIRDVRLAVITAETRADVGRLVEDITDGAQVNERIIPDEGAEVRLCGRARPSTGPAEVFDEDAPRRGERRGRGYD